MAVDMNKITKVTIEKATTPFNGAMVMTNRYWIVIDDCILFFGKNKSPQCNSDQRLAEYINKRLYPEASVKFLPVVYIEHNCYDFM